MSTKLERLLKFIRKFDSVAVAFSGGVDSSALAALCVKELKDVVALTVVSQVTPSREIEYAKRVANEIGVRHKLINLDILDQNFVKNTQDRCFYCKKIMLKTMLSFCKKEGYPVLFEGTNADELKQHRPGYKAVVSFKNVYSPWAKFGFTKAEIRDISKKMGYSFFNKPSLTCLATRIPFGVEIDLNKLRMIDLAENIVLNILNIEQVRVRYLNEIAVIEMEEGDLQKIFKTKIQELVKKLKEIGFKRVFVDLEGYESGKFNELVSFFSFS